VRSPARKKKAPDKQPELMSSGASAGVTSDRKMGPTLTISIYLFARRLSVMAERRQIKWEPQSATRGSLICVEGLKLTGLLASLAQAIGWRP
jgi:hypothetical protein